MEEEEEFWLACNDPLELLKAIHPIRTHGSTHPQTRASRMYLLACARREWLRLPVVCRQFVVLAEMVAEAPRERSRLLAALAPIAARLMQSPCEPCDLLTADAELVANADITEELKLARRFASKPTRPPSPLTADEWPGFKALLYLPFELNTPSYHWVAPERHSLSLLREVYGNPYRVIPFDAAWRTRDVMGMSKQMYESRDFTAMPFLADALQEADCENEAILTHCRDAREHVRGCWVLDQVLQLR